MLESIGFPLYSKVGAAGGYHVLKERILPPIAFSEYEKKIPAIVRKGNVYGIQFHPEKSGEVGLNILRAYGE
ncbi:glutamine amidotransferase-related protein, partial [Clostridioides difficile]|uniref:glutamine amidotransferase-related protein n=1 Tax=Clostridioides difficile TaxID=1496 RepID=UPI003AB4B83E